MAPRQRSRSTETRQASTPKEPLMPTHDEIQHAAEKQSRGELAAQVKDLEEILKGHIEHVYVVHDSTRARAAEEYSISELQALAKGSSPEQWDEYTFFLDKTAADEFADRQHVLQRLSLACQQLGTDDLENLLNNVIGFKSGQIPGDKA